MSVLSLGESPPEAKVLVFGGADPLTNNTYETINVADISPDSSWNPPLEFPDGEYRSLCSAVLLPDGKVFLCGGIQRTHSPCAIINPQDHSWLPAAELPSIRDYHSVALLLPSGQVMMADWHNARIEIYNPPYLFHEPRPTIENAPDIVHHGKSFELETPNADDIAKIVLVRPMAVTHQTCTEQRVVELAFEPDQAEPTLLLTVTVPEEGQLFTLAPRGYYMLFVLNHEGIPSVARWIRLVSPSWQGWFRIGEASQEVPRRSVVWPVSRKADRKDIFVVGHNGGIYTTGQTNGDSWENWQAIGNPGAGQNVPTNSVVSAVSRIATRIDIFVVGHNGGIYTNRQIGGGNWDNWQAIGTPDAGETVPLRSLVWPVTRNDKRLDIFVVGHNGGIYTSGQTDGGKWKKWKAIGDPNTGAHVPTNSVVTAVARPGDRLDIFVVGHNGGIYTSGQNGTSGDWDLWRAIGNPSAGHTVPLRSVVFPIAVNPNRMDIFVVGNNGGIYTTGKSDGHDWEEWRPIGIPEAGQTVPTNSVVWAVSHHPDRLDIFVVGHNGGIYTSGQTNGGNWEDWHAVGIPSAGETVPTRTVVSAISSKPEHIDLFVVGHNGGIYSNSWQ